MTLRQRRTAGSFERLVLLSVERLQADAFGMLIRREIADRTGRAISVGAVYVTLMRMEAKGWVRSVARPKATAAWSRARRFYLVEAPGRRAVRLALRDSDMLRQGLPGLGAPQRPPANVVLRMKPRRGYAGPWPEEPSVVRRARTPRDPRPRGRRMSPPPAEVRFGPWAPWVRWWLLGLMDKGPASW